MYIWKTNKDSSQTLIPQQMKLSSDGTKLYLLLIAKNTSLNKVYLQKQDTEGSIIWAKSYELLGITPGTGGIHWYSS